MAKFTITDHRGGSTGCTGQLLNDLDEETQVPYFLTATHCVKDRRLWSIELYWFYELDTCGGVARQPVRQRPGASVVVENPH